MKKSIFSIILAFILVFSAGYNVAADSVSGDTIVCLGEDLSDEQKSKMLSEFNVSEDEVNIIEISNKEEHEYLGGILPESTIGNVALSSAKITFTEDTGIEVEVSKNINYIDAAMYRNAMQTAGISNARVYISSPVSVTGTAALTGIMKAYEVDTGKKIDKDVKKVANEELVVTSDLAEDIGTEDATQFMNDIKIKISKNMPKDINEIKTIINNLSEEYNITLTDEQVNRIADFFNKFKNLDVDWNKLYDDAVSIANQAKIGRAHV